MGAGSDDDGAVNERRRAVNLLPEIVHLQDRQVSASLYDGDLALFVREVDLVVAGNRRRKVSPSASAVRASLITVPVDASTAVTMPPLLIM